MMSIALGAKMVVAAIGGNCVTDVVLTAINAAKPAALSTAKDIAWKVGAGAAAFTISGAAINDAWTLIDVADHLITGKKKTKKDLNLVSNN